MIIHTMNRVSGFIIIIIIIIIITGALVRISEYHIILDILIKSRYTAVQYRGTQLKFRTAVRNFPRYPKQARVLLKQTSSFALTGFPISR